MQGSRSEECDYIPSGQSTQNNPGAELLGHREAGPLLPGPMYLVGEYSSTAAKTIFVRFDEVGTDDGRAPSVGSPARQDGA